MSETPEVQPTSAVEQETIPAVPDERPTSASRLIILYAPEDVILASGGSPTQESDLSDLPTFPVTIYLSDGENHEQVENAVEAFLIASGLQINFRGDP